jgi:hypothetical protein
MSHFRFHIWIQRGHVRIHVFSSRGKTKTLNLFFSVTVVIVIVLLLPSVEQAPVALVTTVDPLFKLKYYQKFAYC